MSYTITTVLTDIPLSAIRQSHRILLAAMNFEILEQRPQSTADGQATAYIYAEDPVELHGLEMLDEATQAELKELGANDTFAAESFDSSTELRDVLQNILDSAPESVLKHIDVVTSYQGNKPRRGDNGGSAMRIRRDRVLQVDTSTQFNLWSLEDEQTSKMPMRYLLRGPISDDQYLYWNFDHGWGSKDAATPIAHKDMTNGLLLVGLTGVEVITEPDPGVDQRDAALELKVAAANLSKHRIEAMNVLVASTAHLDPSEASILNGSSGAGTILGDDLQVAFEGEYGWIFHIREEMEGLDELSDGLRGAIEYAREFGFDWLRLDRDANELPDVATYSW